ncbi:hypothetical protein Tco_1548337 [Tanacetum coccineum]
MAQHRTSYLLVLLVIVLCIAPRWTSVQAGPCCHENDMISCDPDNAQDQKKLQGNNPTSPRNEILGLGVQVNPLLLGMQVNFPPLQSLGVQVKHFVNLGMAS